MKPPDDRPPPHCSPSMRIARIPPRGRAPGLWRATCGVCSKTCDRPDDGPTAGQWAAWGEVAAMFELEAPAEADDGDAKALDELEGALTAQRAQLVTVDRILERLDKHGSGTSAESIAEVREALRELVGLVSEQLELSVRCGEAAMKRARAILDEAPPPAPWSSPVQAAVPRLRAVPSIPPPGRSEDELFITHRREGCGSFSPDEFRRWAEITVHTRRPGDVVGAGCNMQLSPPRCVEGCQVLERERRLGFRPGGLEPLRKP
jgi:hypothetical protein